VQAEAEAPPKAAYGRVQLDEAALLFDNLGTLAGCQQDVDEEATLPSMETLGQWYGLILYQSSGSFDAAQLRFSSTTLHDRAQLFINDTEIATVYRRECPKTVEVPAGNRMAVLVENMGRINYGAALRDHKGLLTLPPVPGTWNATCLPLHPSQVQKLRFSLAQQSLDSFLAMLSTDTAGPPTFRRGTLRVSGEPADTFLDTDGLTKGYIWANGHALGRFWETAGPQHALYLPAPFLLEGDNEIIVLDLHGAGAAGIMSVADPRYK